MTRGRGRHLTREAREVIEGGVRGGESARRIAAAVGVSPSTVTREVLNNRTVRQSDAKSIKPATRCARYGECEKVGEACGGCGTRWTSCRDCGTRACIERCPDFELRMCPTTESWPYVCPEACPRRGRGCRLPKCSYRAEEADATYRERLRSSRAGADLTEGELAALDARVAPLVRQGHSFEAICAEEQGLGVCVRTLYNYQDRGLLSCADIELPRKVRVRKRRKKEGKRGRDRVDRTGRTHADWLALPMEERARTVQGDSVEGMQGEAHDVLSLHVVARRFQLYLLKGHADAAEVVACLDAIERAMGSPDAFRAALDPLLVDRGVEFDDWAGMERSCLRPGEARCRVFYCDPMESDQKSQCERNHEQLRRILPKGRTHMDALSAGDVALACSHVNSYPLATLGGRSPIDELGGLLGEGVLGLLGVRRLEPRDVVLRPSLLPHAVDQ